MLIKKSNDAGVVYDFDTLKYLVDTNNKKRFAFNETFDKIRASQGHSVDVDLGYRPQVPPEILYQGRATRSVESILLSGLEKRSRQHVHLSKDVETAVKVGQRHGKVFVFEVLAALMHADKFDLFLSENEVWLTDYVPAKYLKQY